MASLNPASTIAEYSSFVDAVYGIPNDRAYTHWDLLTQIQRFTMRAIKGIRKGDRKKVEINIMITFSWFTSLMNRLHISISDIVWERFPYLCSYCGEAPCNCRAEKVEVRRKIVPDGSRKPQTIAEFQLMFNKVYPADRRDVKDAGIHLAEESGELSEAVQYYMGDRSEAHLDEVKLEAADFFSCLMGVLNSEGIDLAAILAKEFPNNCHVCHNAPCTCTYGSVSKYKS
jgi:NTP pyrophosphatase (non-canonical NTP hydrolase)